MDGCGHFRPQQAYPRRPVSGIAPLAGGSVRLRPGAVPPPGQGVALDPLAVVRAAMNGESIGSEQPKRRMVGGGFSMTTVSPALRKLGVLYAIYLCFASLRIQEIITPLAIPKLPMVMSLVLASGLVLGVPGSGWKQLWRQVPALRWQALITGLAIVTVPLGIWVSYSLERLYPGYFISVMVMVGAVVLLRDRVVLTRVIQLLTFVIGLITALVLMGVGAALVEDIGRLAVGDSLDPNDFAWILATFVPLALWLAVRNKVTAIFWFGVAVLLVLGIVPTQSRGGFVALIAVGMTLIVAGASGWRRILMLAVLAVLGAILISYAASTGASRLTDFGGYEGGTGRTELWTQGLKWMVQRPWGFGMGNYGTYNVIMTRSGLNAHSAYIGIGVELGVAALVAYLAIWLGVIRGLVQLRRKATSLANNPGVGAEASLVGFVLAAMIGNAVGSAFLNTHYAAFTLLIQGLGAAVLVGSPLRTLPAATQAATQPSGRYRSRPMHVSRQTHAPGSHPQTDRQPSPRRA